MFDSSARCGRLSSLDPQQWTGDTRTVTEQPLPDRAESDADVSWGEEPQDNEERLEAERPPHYDQ